MQHTHTHPHPHSPHAFRPPGYDHRALGGYFITVHTAHREPLFGVTRGSRLLLTKSGLIARACWAAIPARFPHLELDAFVVMPDQLRGILLLRRRSLTPLGLVVRSFKSAVKTQVNLVRATPGEAVWQWRYQDQVIRSAKAMESMRRLLTINPWAGKPSAVSRSATAVSHKP